MGFGARSSLKLASSCITVSKSSHRIAAAGVRHVHQVRQQARALDVAQELDAQAVAQVRAFDQAGDIGHHEAAEIVELHHAQVAARGW